MKREIGQNTSVVMVSLQLLRGLFLVIQSRGPIQIVIFRMTEAH